MVVITVVVVERGRERERKGERGGSLPCLCPEFEAVLWGCL